MKPPDWMRQAACLDADPDMFFEKAGEAEAKACCRDCPVDLACLRYAREERIDWGVWGGMNPAERCGRGRPQKAIVHGTYTGYRTHLRRDEKACAACMKANNDYRELMVTRKNGARRYLKCSHPFGCEQWAMRDHPLCWVHARGKAAAGA